jgi:chemotaxis protein methyltransferase CheR
MREEAHYEFLRNEILVPALKKAPIGGIKIWSAASSTGEEPYCISMLATSVFGVGAKSKVSITASDISTNVLRIAKNGVYTQDKIAKLPTTWVQNYMKKIDNINYEINTNIKNLVDFKYFNLNQSIGWEFRKYDVIFCRNVMIYFDKTTREELIAKVYEAMEPGGYLFVGRTETIDRSNTPFHMIQPSIFRK